MYGLGLDGTGRVQTLLEDIRQNYAIILTTRKGEKIGDPEFGCAVWDKLDRPMPQVPSMVADVVRALNRDEPRAVVQSVKPDFGNAGGDSGAGKVTLYIRYRIIATGEEQDGVFELS